MAVAAQRIPKGAAQTGHLSPARPVAGYLRSATELEGDSLRKQLEAVLRFARHRDMQLIRIYCDECGSGLRIDNRPGLRQLFRDIDSGARDFGAVLLLDPSRWSRSLNPDHGPYLEDRCRKAGIRVHYCAEGLAGEESPYSSTFKALKRAMAREHRRELTARRHRAASTRARDNAAEQGDGSPRP